MSKTPKKWEALGKAYIQKVNKGVIKEEEYIKHIERTMKQSTTYDHYKLVFQTISDILILVIMVIKKSPLLYEILCVYTKNLLIKTHAILSCAYITLHPTSDVS